MLPILRVLACLSLCSLASHAQLVIYKGNVKASASNEAKARVTGSYLLFDLAANQYKTIDFNSSRSNKDKSYFVQDTSGIHSTTLSLAQGKSKTVIIPDDSNLSLGEASDDLTVIFTTFQGINATLPVGGKAEKATFPKLFTLRGLYVQSESDNAFSIEGSGLMTFQAKLTVQENEAEHTIDEAADTIAALLEKQGYSVARPID